MSNNNKDFFDEEWEKKNAEQQRLNEQRNTQADGAFYSWQNLSSHQPDNGTGTTKSRKAVTITIVAVALVLVFVLGFVCAVFFNNNRSQDNILGDVLDVIRNYYYEDLTDEEWANMIANGGKGLLQSLDQYSVLCTPQEAYNLVYGSGSSSGIGDAPSFGVSMNLISGVGLQIVSVVADSSAYGILQSGDIIMNFVNPVTQEGTPVKDTDGQEVTDFYFGDKTMDEVNYVLGQTYRTTFRVLRNGNLVEEELERSVVGQGVDYKGMNFVRYYVKAPNGNQYYNISMPQNRTNNTYTMRNLDQLEEGIGYIQLMEYNEIVDANGQKVVNAADEVKEVLTLFKSLGVKNIVLDLKGNPGGYVNVASDIIGMLANTDNLTEQKIKDNKITKDGKMLTTYLVGKNDKTVDTYYATSTYSNYFDNDGKIHIAIWTDGGSASASELTTGALLDYGTAIQMGEKTYGKGIAQGLIKLPYTGTIVNNEGKQQQYNWYVYMTIARFYSPLGSNIHGVGYTPTNKYNGLTEYSQLVEAVNAYWN